ncbi:MAG TPA: SRPBCC family protein, partial [Actinomycetota bacterium]
MKIEQNVEVDAPLDRVWALVNDVPRIAPCMPGAQLTNVVDDRTYEGTIRVKLGPINMSYKGTAVLDEVDESTHSARLTASGKDVRGGGTARAGVLMKLEQRSETSTSMAVTADVQLTGKVASFGRGAIQDVSAKLFGQFAQCLRETLEEEGRAAAPAAADAGATGGDGGDGGDGGAGGNGGGGAATAGTATAQPGAAPAPAGGETVPSAGTAASAGTAGATAQAPGAGGQTAADAAAVTEAETQAAAATAGEAGAPLPVCFLHDVGWPYGRRDLYYAPERIP